MKVVVVMTVLLVTGKFGKIVLMSLMRKLQVQKTQELRVLL